GAAAVGSRIRGGGGRGGGRRRPDRPSPPANSLTGVLSVFGLVLALLSFVPAAGNDLPTAKPKQVGLSSERLERIGQVLRNDVERGRIPVAVVVARRRRRGAAVQAVGFRDKAANAAMTPDAIF